MIFWGTVYVKSCGNKIITEGVNGAEDIQHMLNHDWWDFIILLRFLSFVNIH